MGTARRRHEPDGWGSTSATITIIALDETNEKRTVSVLAKLLRTELREVRFSVARVERTDSEVRPDQSTTTTLEFTSPKEFNADGLKDFHSAGAWQRDLFRFELRVQARLIGDSATRFERLLDDLGVQFDGHVAHALDSLLPGYTHGTRTRDSPDACIGVTGAADLWSFLLIDACLGTPRRTATKMLGWTRGARLGFETRVLLGRLRASEPFTLTNGLAVERLPPTSEDLEHRFPIGVGIAPSEYLDRTMLRIPCTIVPVLWKPGRVTEQRRGVPTKRWQTGQGVESAWPLPAGGIHELTRALSLVCDVAVETPMIWTDYGDHAHFGQRHGASNSGSGEPIPRSVSESPVTARHLKEALRLQPQLCEPPGSVHPALKYWLKSKDRRVEASDSLVFLRTALEALFLPAGNSGELTFRLATYGAWYTGRNRDERRDRFNLLKKVYGAASGAVHGRGLRRSDSALLPEGQEICRQAILKRLRSERDPA